MRNHSLNTMLAARGLLMSKDKCDNQQNLDFANIATAIRSSGNTLRRQTQYARAMWTPAQLDTEYAIADSIRRARYGRARMNKLSRVALFYGNLFRDDGYDGSFPACS